MMCVNLSDIAVLKTKVADYGCLISGISKSEAINLMQNAAWLKNVEHCKKT